MLLMWEGKVVAAADAEADPADDADAAETNWKHNTPDQDD